MKPAFVWDIMTLGKRLRDDVVNNFGGIMVWGAMCYGSRFPLRFIQGSMTAQRYIQEVLQPVTIPFACGHKGTLYARPHIAQIFMQCLEEAGVDVASVAAQFARSIAHRTCGT
jgi:hypothetical protein